MHRMKTILSLAVSSILWSMAWAITPPDAIAAFVCYRETLYPSVAKLENTDQGLRAYLVDRFSAETPGKQPTLRYSEDTGWVQDTPAPCQGYECEMEIGHEKSPIPLPTLSREEAVRLRPELKDATDVEQEVGAWTGYGRWLWFGIRFYEGEGTAGVGGIGRFDLKTQKIEIRRPRLLQDTSINHILHDGHALWLGTTGYYECLGLPPTLGLVRYDWQTDRIETFGDKPLGQGPCGFVIHGLALRKNDLWVATDLGLSKRHGTSGAWEHVVPNLHASPPMRPTTCASLYRDLLRNFPKTPSPDFEGSSYQQLFGTLATFHPQFLLTEVKQRSPESWTCNDLYLLASQVGTLGALRRDLLSVRPVGTPDVQCLLKGFARTGGRDPAWRDVLLEVLAAQDKDRQAAAVAFDLLAQFKGDATVSALMVQRFQTDDEPSEEVLLLPELLGRQSVSLLIEGLDRFQASPVMVSRLRRALVHATRLYLDQDEETLGPVPPESDEMDWRGRYPTEEQWKAWWKTHKAEYP